MKISELTGREMTSDGKNELVEKYVLIYGERYRKLLADAIPFAADQRVIRFANQAANRLRL